MNDTSFRSCLVAHLGTRLDGVTMVLEVLTNWELIPVYNEQW
jgi:hypothetical protein